MGSQWNYVPLKVFSIWFFCIALQFNADFRVSPLIDLLDTGNFTLEDLLREDELIQEVKAKNDTLIELLVAIFVFVMCIY